jgi:hypothetical protein
MRTSGYGGKNTPKKLSGRGKFIAEWRKNNPNRRSTSAPGRATTTTTTTRTPAAVSSGPPKPTRISEARSNFYGTSPAPKPRTSSASTSVGQGAPSGRRTNASLVAEIARLKARLK